MEGVELLVPEADKHSWKNSRVVWPDIDTELLDRAERLLQIPSTCT